MTAALPALSVTSVSKRYGGTLALDNVSVSFSEGRIYGLVGINGSGKSTLIKIICGIEQPTSLDGIAFHGTRCEGPISPELAHRHGVRVLHQRPAQFLDLSVTENLLLPNVGNGRFGVFNWREANARVERILSSVGMDIDPRARFDRYSPAQRTLALIAKLLSDGDDGNTVSDHRRIVILDEPTAALPDAEARWLLEKLQAQKAAGHCIIYVSHRLDELFYVAYEMVVLRNGKLIGNLQRDETNERHLVTMLLGHELKAAEPARRVGQSGASSNARVPRIELKGIAGREARAIDLTAYAGEIVGLTGIIGSGFLETAEIIFGAAKKKAGSILIDGQPFLAAHPCDAMRAGIGLVPSDRTEMALFTPWAVSENFVVPQHSVPVPDALDSKQAIASYGVKTSGPDAKIWTLSGGNQQKVVLARWMERKPKLLLLCEPTAGVDPGARDDLHTLIRKAAAEGCTVLVASTDADELEALVHRTLIINRGIVSAEVAGGPGSKARIREKIL